MDVIECRSAAERKIDGGTHAIDVSREATEQRLPCALEQPGCRAYGARHAGRATGYEGNIGSQGRTGIVKGRTAAAMFADGEGAVAGWGESQVVTQ